MRDTGYTVIRYTSRARKAWDALGPDLQAEVDNQLSRHPKGEPARPKVHDHLKGKILGKKRYCHHEYRGLPDARRVFYTVDDKKRRVEIEYIGPHPK